MFASWLNETSHHCGNTVAIQSTQTSVDYSQFAAILSSIAYQLRVALGQDSVTSDSEGVGLPDNTALVGVCVTPVWKQIVSYFGVLDAELTYVPLDPTVSDERLKKILSKSQCRFVVTERASASRFDELDVITLNIDDILESGDMAELQSSPELHGNASSASNLKKTAYVMYTSGSTGEPKGVMVSHANLIYSTQARIAYYRENQPRFMLLSPTVFDSSVVGIYWTLLGGGSLIAPERDEVKDVQLIAKLIEQHKVDTILCLPTYYRLLLDGAEPRQLSTLKRVILAGEACSEAIVDLHYQSIPNTELFNEYGPTECTVWSSVARLEHDRSPVTIGHAIPGTAINIVDEHGYAVPVGTIGEIAVSGPGVARGYLFDELETSKRFYSSLPAFDEANAYKTYRTGDLGSFTAEQQLQFHGRIDRQIKIRGHRIEPAEIENVAMRMSAVGECVAIGVASTRPNDSAEVSLKNASRTIAEPLFSQIAVYLTAASASNGNEQDKGYLIDPMRLCEEVLNRIESSLPAYMHPAQVLVIDEFPKTATDKVDITGMQTCQILAQASKTKGRTSNLEASSPSLDTSVQRIFNQLESIAEDVLQVSHILADDTFNELGGDSISAIMFVSRARERGLSCDIKQLAADKSFGVIAAELAEIESASISDSVNDAISNSGPSKLTPIQQWYFSLQNLKPGSLEYCLPDQPGPQD